MDEKFKYHNNGIIKSLNLQSREEKSFLQHMIVLISVNVYASFLLFSLINFLTHYEMHEVRRNCKSLILRRWKERKYKLPRNKHNILYYADFIKFWTHKSIDLSNNICIMQWKTSRPQLVMVSLRIFHLP